jgi:hypothetical protein
VGVVEEVSQVEGGATMTFEEDVERMSVVIVKA